jgi:hypothetical protein
MPCEKVSRAWLTGIDPLLSSMTVRFAETRFNAIGSPLKSQMAFVTSRVTLRHAQAQVELNNYRVRPGRNVHDAKLVEASR